MSKIEILAQLHNYAGLAYVKSVEKPMNILGNNPTKDNAPLFLDKHKTLMKLSWIKRLLYKLRLWNFKMSEDSLK